MALMDVADVVQMVATLLDDPGQTTFDADYVVPFINVRWNNMAVNLAMLGLQYSEQVVVFDLPANTLTLAAYMATGQPLASMMQPKSLEWKLVGAPDTEYQPIGSVNELDDVPPGSEGIDEYSWQGGTCQLNPSSVAVTLRVRFMAMSTTLVDPTDQMVRGVGDVLSYRVAELIYSILGNDKLSAKMQQLGSDALEDFNTLSTMRLQSQPIYFPPVHRRRGRFFARA